MPAKPFLNRLTSTFSPLFQRKRNRRQHERIQADLNMTGLHLKKGQAIISAGLVDFSQGGMSFVATKEAFNVGDSISITFNSVEGKKHHLEAEVVAQKIYYPHGTEDLDRALFRYSVKFGQEADADHLKKLVQSHPPFFTAA